MEMDSMSSLPGNNSPPMDLSDIVAANGNVSSLIKNLEDTKKREHADPMDSDEIDTASTPKRRKLNKNNK